MHDLTVSVARYPLDRRRPTIRLDFPSSGAATDR
jgi:hypothetical protein